MRVTWAIIIWLLLDGRAVMVRGLRCWQVFGGTMLGATTKIGIANLRSERRFWFWMLIGVIFIHLFHWCVLLAKWRTAANSTRSIRVFAMLAEYLVMYRHKWWQALIILHINWAAKWITLVAWHFTIWCFLRVNWINFRNTIYTHINLRIHARYHTACVPLIIRVYLTVALLSASI